MTGATISVSALIALFLLGLPRAAREKGLTATEAVGAGAGAGDALENSWATGGCSVWDGSCCCCWVWNLAARNKILAFQKKKITKI